MPVNFCRLGPLYLSDEIEKINVGLGLGLGFKQAKIIYLTLASFVAWIASLKKS